MQEKGVKKMPNINGKKFKYNAAGIEAAKEEAKKMNKPMMMDGGQMDIKKYAAGGMTDGRERSEQMYAGGGKTGYNKIGMPDKKMHGGVMMEDKKMMMGGGQMKNKMMYKDGGKTMKPVDSSKNPGLAKLPTKVRNKMGYMKDGGLTPSQTKRLKKHSDHHSAKHMNEMKKDMKSGSTFTEAHNKAMKKVGK